MISRFTTGDKREKTVSFTLMELLVVVAIIALLASLLLPALSKARAKVRGVVCRSNQRQLALAVGLYADDWKEVLPRPTAVPNDASAWFYVIDSYLKNTPVGSTPTTAQRLALVKQDPIWTTFDAGSRTNWRTIKMNRKLVGNSGQSATLSVSNAVPAWRRRADIVRPVTTPLLMDGSVEVTGSTVIQAQYHAWEVYVELRHFSGANLCFVDGHLEWWNKGIPQTNGVGWNSDSTPLDWWVE